MRPGGSKIPFEVLGQVSPVLCWVEGHGSGSLPETWTHRAVDQRERERSWLLSELPTYSIDNVHEIIRHSRDQAARHFSYPTLDQRSSRLRSPDDYDLGTALRKLGEQYFVWNGGELCIREGRMEELHELALRFPVGHVIRHSHALGVARGLLAARDAIQLPEQMSLLPSNSYGLRRVMRRGLSEGHLHLKGVTSAEEHWADNLLDTYSARSIHSASEAQRRLLRLDILCGRILAFALLSCRDSSWFRAAFARRLLVEIDALYFARTALEEEVAIESLTVSFRELLETLCGFESLHSDLHSEGQGTRRRKGVERDSRDPIKTFRSDDLWLLYWTFPGLRPFLSRHRALLSEKEGGAGLEPPSTFEGRVRWVECLHLQVHKELVANPRSDVRRTFLHAALFRYLVCRTHHWQKATQSGRTTGLTNFRRFYGAPERRAPSLEEAEFGYCRQVMQRLSEWRGLRVLEGRISPPKHPRDLARWLYGFAKVTKPQRLRKFGLVVHFKKEEESKEDKGLRAEGIPRLRWGKRRRCVAREGNRLYRFLSSGERWAPFIVGIDACNIELATPPEVFAPVFRFLRELPIEQRQRGDFYSGDQELRQAVSRVGEKRRLGMTYHVGEDFRHLLSGLRAIHEVVEFLEPQPGDRLGHATALALSPTHWAEQVGYQAVLPSLEWLDTLVWVHHLLGPGNATAGKLGLEDKIQRLAWKIYSRALFPRRKNKPMTFREVSQELEKDWSPLTLHDAWLLRQLDPYSVDLSKLIRGELVLREPWGFTEEERRWNRIQCRVRDRVIEQIGSENAFVLLALYWLNDHVRKAGSEIEFIDMRPQKELWLDLCQQVETRMKEIVHERELVVEVNPSSNRIIGPIAHYREHHVFNLTLSERKDLLRQVRVSVNTDNPAVCNTSLSHEYYLLGEIRMGEGVPEAEVSEWLDWLRENGQEYSFVRRLPGPEDPDMKKILDSFRDYRPTVREAVGRREKLGEFWTWFRRDPMLAHHAHRLGLPPEAEALLGRLQRMRARIGELERAEQAEFAAADLRQEIDALEKRLRSAAAEGRS